MECIDDDYRQESRMNTGITPAVALVTGAASGLGRELALQLAAGRYSVVCVDYDADGLRKLEAELRAAGRSALCVQANIARRDEIVALMQRVDELHGRLDLLINNAGVIHPFSRIEKLDRQLAARVFDINFWGTTHMTIEALPLLRKGRSPLLLNIASIGAVVTTMGQGYYCASKAAIVQLTETLELELASDGIDVMLALPGAMNTNIMANAPGAGGNASHEKMQASLRAGGRLAQRLLTTPADAAHRILSSLKRRPRRLYIGIDARMLSIMSRFMPVTSRRLIAMAIRKVPALRDALQ
jgi:NAD(P)-dependent dehydrogenase (short-subunit alcohol dehydrogenase family)